MNCCLKVEGSWRTSCVGSKRGAGKWLGVMAAWKCASSHTRAVGAFRSYILRGNRVELICMAAV